MIFSIIIFFPLSERLLNYFPAARAKRLLIKTMVGIVSDFFSSRFCASVRSPRSPVIKTPIINKPTVIRFLIFSQMLIIVFPLPRLTPVNPVHLVFFWKCLFYLTSTENRGKRRTLEMTWGETADTQLRVNGQRDNKVAVSPSRPLTCSLSPL